MDLRQRALSPVGSISVATALLLLAFLENTVLPWAPFFFVYAALTTAVPVVVGACPFGRLRSVRPSAWALVVIAPVILQGVASVWVAVAWPGVLGLAGVRPEMAHEPFYFFPAALESMFRTAAELWKTDPERIQTVYLSSIVLWAGLGEELFFRGYMHAAMRSRGIATAVVASAAFFAVRHATQLALVGPHFPWGAAFSWVFLAFWVGIAMSLLYEKTGSLYPPVIAHYLFNLIPFVGMIAGGGSGG